MTGNVAFMFVCTIMVFFMTPGLAFFYGGMVRRKNALNTMMFCMAMMGIGMLLWFLCGYSLSFGKDHAGIIGDLNNVLMRNVSWEVTGGEGDAPEMVSALFNMMFAVISPAIILGAVAERMKFSKMMLFVVIWSFLVYYPLAHMAWGGGLLEMIGSIDFAGGNVIHISTGVSGLTACIILGSRKGYGAMSYHPHNIPLFLLGASMLWMGWFCFNCGCAGGANSIAVLAFANTALFLRRKHGGMDAHRSTGAEKVHRHGCRDWRHRGAGRHHAGSRLCAAVVVPDHRCNGSSDLLSGNFQDEEKVRL